MVVVAAIWLELCVIAVVYGLCVSAYSLYCRFISHVTGVYQVYNTTTWDGLVCNSHKSQQRVCYNIISVAWSDYECMRCKWT